MKKFEKSTNGITLIALVITIIVLVIVSSVGIYLSLGNNGIFTKAQESKEKTQRETATEKINLKITTAQMNSYAETQEMPTLKELSLILKEDSEISYVTEESKVASAEYNVPSENPSAIYTKLKDYDYEFGINSSLQLASIDGVKVAENDVSLESRIEKLESEKIDYSKEENYIDVSIDSGTINASTWRKEISGPELSSGTWSIIISIKSNIEGSHNSTLEGTGCTAVNTTAWSGNNQTSGFYKGEGTVLKANVYNGYSKQINYTIRFRAVKISNTY